MRRPFENSEPSEQASDLGLCLDRALQRDPAAAAELVRRLYPTVIWVIRNRLPRRMDEEDMVQEVFGRVFAGLDRFQGPPEALFSWARRIAVNTCLNQMRWNRSRPEWRWADLSESQVQVLDQATNDEGEVAPNHYAEAHELVNRLMEGLNPKDRLVIQLLELEEKTIAQIQTETGWSSANIRVRAFRARRKLRKLLDALLASERSQP